MEKGELRKLNYLLDDEDDKKDNYLKELGNAVHNYMKTGVKNKQLDDLAELEEKFQQKYQERLDIKEIADLISQSSQKKMNEIGKDYKWKIDAANNQENPEKVYINNIEKVSELISKTVAEVIVDRLQKVIKDTAYLSHMNMLYELFEQEEQLRREEEEYERISKRYQKMADIAKTLSNQRRMEIELLQKKADVSQKELEELLSRNGKYFNVREKQNSVQISLSPAGRKYNEYIVNWQERYSKKAVDQLIYKNCSNLIEALENSYDSGIEFEPRLEQISSGMERALQSRYHRTMQKIISENEQVYTVKDYIIEENRERERINNEKNRIRIPREWDYESD
ncbi:MAG: hypothetical protein K2K90_04910 [Lachnospiraceae bacterium]|nr:hypothetical protein [Lachnospiraceae bacterium]